MPDKIDQSQNISIAQLAAGVAHEINNPSSFVASNLEVLETYIDGYLKMIALTNELKAAVEKGSKQEMDTALARMKEFEESANLEFIVNDSQKLLQQSREGIARVEKIVSDLRAFAHEDTQWLEELIRIEDIIEMSIDSARSEFQDRIELRKEYGDTPQVRCNAQKVGQVFLNLLMNAAQAIPEKGVIKVKTHAKGDQVFIEVSDTGVGIPAENLSRIFDPFFSTKPVGKGSGLGLSVGYELIKQQGGEIRVVSEVGKGTTFTVVVPVPLARTDKKA